MKIVVCMKQVPDTETKVRIGPDGKTIDPTDVNYVVNPYDEYAVEEALKIKEEKGDGEVTILTLGPDRAIKAIRTALAMGADKAIHLKTDDKYLDSYAVAAALAHELKDMEYDLILTGKQAVDDDAAQIGARLGALLDIPCATVVTKLTIEDSTFTANREVEGGVEIVEGSLPAVITAQKGLNEPRYASLKGIMMAKRKPLEEKEPQLDEEKLEILKMEYPPERKGGRIVGKGPEAVPELVRLLHEEAKVI
ncbi:electron transfer flavoprotein subunit beta [bacterium BMS3Abin05]|nr:electron transfer flavoprotein subunit beta [bacterium BMS3Abin05]GBE27951.1 electron transfer flavoprotein subunit beta [bacterium BMS3Bbin03]